MALLAEEEGRIPAEVGSTVQSRAEVESMVRILVEVESVVRSLAEAGPTH